MPRLLLTLRYDGTRYHGWQVQPNGVTVQQVMQDAVERLTGVRSGLTGCSRTDAGRTRQHVLLHPGYRLSPAGGQAGGPLSTPICQPTWPCTAAGRCRRISIPGIWPRASGMSTVSGTPPHAIPSGRATLCIGSAGWTSAAWTRPPRLTAARMILRAFCSAGSAVEDRVRTVRRCGVSRQGDLVTFTVEADGFLYNMVRIMVGTLLDMDAGRIPWDALPAILLSRDRTGGGHRSGLRAVSG